SSTPCCEEGCHGPNFTNPVLNWEATKSYSILWNLESTDGKGLGLQPCPPEIPLAPPNRPLSGCCGAPRSSSAQAPWPQASPKKFLGVFPSTSGVNNDSGRGPLPNLLGSMQQCELSGPVQSRFLQPERMLSTVHVLTSLQNAKPTQPSVVEEMLLLLLYHLTHERPRGGLPPRFWADPSSLTGEFAEEKGLRRSQWLLPSALFLVIVVPLGPPQPRLNSLSHPKNSWGCSPPPPEKTRTAVVVFSTMSWDPGSSVGVPTHFLLNGKDKQQGQDPDETQEQTGQNQGQNMGNDEELAPEQKTQQKQTREQTLKQETQQERTQKLGKRDKMDQHKNQEQTWEQTQKLGHQEQKQQNKNQECTWMHEQNSQQKQTEDKKSARREAEETTKDDKQ
ncbi:hypothetical protein P4O66_017896, partial [Electrophorus voltai]